MSNHDIKAIRESRKSQRSVAEYFIRFGVGESVHAGLTKDFSSTGIFIKSGIFFPVGTKIDIELSLSDDYKASIDGVVVWIKVTPSGENDRLTAQGMGVRILYASREYQLFIETHAIEGCAIKV